MAGARLGFLGRLDGPLGRLGGMGLRLAVPRPSLGVCEAVRGY